MILICSDISMREKRILWNDGNLNKFKIEIVLKYNIEVMYGVNVTIKNYLLFNLTNFMKFSSQLKLM